MDPIQYFSVDPLDEMLDNSVAMESMDGDIDTVTKYFRQSSKRILYDYEKAMKAEDYKTAVTALNELESMISQCKRDLDRIPAESQTEYTLRFIGKMTSFVIGTILMFNIGNVSGKTARLLKNAMSQVTDATLKAQVEAAINSGVVDTTVKTAFTMQGMDLHVSAARSISIPAIYRAITQPIDDETKMKYKDDPKHISKNYLRLQKLLDSSLLQLREAKTVLHREAATKKI